MNPVDPDEARRRILEELSRSEYREGDGFIAWLLGVIEAFLDRMVADVSGSGPAQWAIGIGGGLLAVALLVLVARRTGLLRGSGALSVSAALDGEEVAGADELRVRSRLALDAGRLDDAVVLALRSLVRDLDERTLLEVSAGMTAHEVAAAASVPFPDLRRRLDLAAAAFDTAAYSRRSASAKQAEDAVRLVEYVAQTTPDLARLAGEGAAP
ncbi:DUF4129 domain-containing protein [Brachybacterium hainanense]|uniref:DUF4129 domain-containing protein n=1 Tax=Brachybacterium hainanense TaxID=1541174 RepID=A0ABV6RBW9_9MICO